MIEERKGSASILPNSVPHILQPMKKGLQVRWEDENDRHTLFHERTPVASHHNGFSCHNLAERIIAGDTERVLHQAIYIIQCGGVLHCSSYYLIDLALGEATS